MLAFSDAQVDAAARAAQRVLRDAATFGSVDRNLLRASGVAGDVARAVDRAWRKKGALAAARAAPELPPLALWASAWQLQLEMGRDRALGQAAPAAVFQLALAEDGAQVRGTVGRPPSLRLALALTRELRSDGRCRPRPQPEPLELELDHGQLRALLLQLDAAQRELDAARAPPSA